MGGKTGSEGTGAKVKLLSGGNPQIARGDGDGPVQAYIAAMPEWKHAIGVQLDRIISDVVPGVRKAVKWNSPLYGAGDDGWFLSWHCMTRYVKVAFHRGAELDPLPPVASTQPLVRYLHVSPEDPLDEARFAEWVRQAGRLPGVKM